MKASPAPSALGGRLRFTSEGLAWFAAAAVLGTLGWLKSLNLLLLLAYLMLALLVINGILARIHCRRIRADRVPLSPVFAGDDARLALLVRNQGTRIASITIRAGGTQWNVERLAPNGALECVETVRFPKRGRIALAPVAIGSAFPFGFLRYERAEASNDSVVVLPAVGQADAEGLRRWLLRMAGAEGRSRKVLRRVTNDLADVRGVRPYRPGDSIRAIHWRSSARRRELMVREYDAAPSPELLLVVEPWLPANPTARDRANLEAALSLAATAVLVWCRSIATRLTVMVAGVEVCSTSGPPNDSFAREALIPLAETGIVASQTTFDPNTFGRSVARAARVVVSSRANTPLADALARAAGKPFIALDPSQRLPWYLPPKVG